MSILNIMVCKFQETYRKYLKYQNEGALNIVIPGSEISKWFRHQSMGNIVNSQVTYMNKNEWIGIAVCAVLCHDFNGDFLCDILINERCVSDFMMAWIDKSVQIKSGHLLMSYIPLQLICGFEGAEYEIDENGFMQVGLRFGWYINKCGFRVVYEQDMEDIREMLSAQSSNSTLHHSL